METEVQKTCKRRAKVIKALAHVSRLYMVEMLSGHERCVDELTELVGSDLLPASMHLHILKNAGIVIGEKRGGAVYYTLRLPSILDFLKCADLSAAGNEKDMANRPRIEEEK